MRARFLLLALIVTACAGGRGSVGNTALPGHGAITIAINPNPVVATRVSGSTYDFPFEVVVRETGGHPVEVTSVSATVFALGGIQIASESYDAARIAQLGYSTHLPANGEVRYRFNPRRDVTDERLFSGVSADVRVDGHDDSGAPTTAGTRVTVTRG
ncbi:MAG TPA: hypothetical protein VF980_01000 [Thermoanaerobaculia bacterium]